jgi:Family of unknown function (DUF6498)
MQEYLRGLALRVAGDRTAAGLLAGNVVAIAIAVFYPPITMSVMFLYWAECVIIGLLNIVKLYYIDAQTVVPGYISLTESEWAQSSAAKKLAIRSVMPGFFLVSYGVCVFTLFGILASLAEHEMRSGGLPGYDMASHLAGFWPPVLVIGAGHVVSFYRNFLGKREYQERKLYEQMFQPYKRVALMFAIVFGGSVVVIVTRLPGMALLVFVPFKIIADLEAHFRERGVNSPAEDRGP